MHRTTRIRFSTLVATAATALLLAAWGVTPAVSADLPSGERLVGSGSHGGAVEPAYNADTGELMYLLTPTGAPFPAVSNPKAASPLYMVMYPPSWSGTLNCMGVPGNCPDHDGLAAGIATGAQPSVYGTDPAAVPGHDHIADPPGAPDWNVAWDVVEVVWTPKAVDEHAITHLTTDAAIDQAVAYGYAQEIPLGIAFNCSVVSPTVYAHGTTLG